MASTTAVRFRVNIFRNACVKVMETSSCTRFAGAPGMSGLMPKVNVQSIGEILNLTPFAYTS